MGAAKKSFACLLLAAVLVGAWNDIAGCLTYKVSLSLLLMRACGRVDGKEDAVHACLKKKRPSLSLPLSVLEGTHHVFQGCPGGLHGKGPKGWHHAASVDMVHWEDRGIHVKAIPESYDGFTSNTVRAIPCLYLSNLC